MLQPSFDKEFFRKFELCTTNTLPNDEAVVFCALSNGGTRVAIGNSDKKLAMYGLEDINFSLLYVLDTFTNWVQSCCFSANDRYLAALASNEVTIYDVLMSKTIKKYIPHGIGCNSIKWTRRNTPEKFTLASCGLDGTIKLWSMTDLSDEKNKLSRNIEYPSKPTCLLGVIQLEKWTSSDKKSIFAKGHRKDVTSIAYSSDDSFLLSGGNDNRLLLWNVAEVDQFQLCYIEEYVGHFDTILSIAWSNDNTRFVSGGNDYRLLLWKLHQLSPIQWFDGHTDIIENVQFLCHNYIISSGRDRYFFVWDTNSVTEYPDTMDIKDKVVSWLVGW